MAHLLGFLADGDVLVRHPLLGVHAGGDALAVGHEVVLVAAAPGVAELQALPLLRVVVKPGEGVLAGAGPGGQQAVPQLKLHAGDEGRDGREDGGARGGGGDGRRVARGRRRFWGRRVVVVAAAAAAADIAGGLAGSLRVELVDGPPWRSWAHAAALLLQAGALGLGIEPG